MDDGQEIIDVEMFLYNGFFFFFNEQIFDNLKRLDCNGVFDK